MDELAIFRKFTIWPCLLAGSIPVVYIFAYMSIGGVYPHWDPAEYMETGLGIYNVFVDQGFVQGIKALYFHRGWRPSLGPVLIVPFYALTGGKALAAMHIVCPVLYSVFLLYVALVLRSLLGGIRLVFAFVLTATHITLVSIGLDFWSELPYFVASIAVLYHFRECNFFQNRRHSVAAGIALGLALCFRPIVGSGTFAVPLFIYLCLAVRKGTIQWRDVAVWSLYVAAGLTITVGLYLIPGTKSWFGLGLLGLLIVTTVVAAFGIGRRFRLSANNLFVASAAFAPTLWWFGLFGAEVFGWAFANTLGDLVRVQLDLFPHPRDSTIPFLKIIAKYTITLPSLGVLAVVLAFMVVHAFRQRKLPRPGTTAVLVGAIFIVPLLGTLATYNGDPRYLIVPAFLLILSCTVWFLSGATSGASTLRRIAILSPALVLQVTFLVSRMAPLPDNMQTALDRFLLSPIFPRPLPMWVGQRHPAEPVYERILELVGESSESRIGVIIPKAFAYLNIPDVNLIATENKQALVLTLASQLFREGPGLNDELRVRYLSQKLTHVLIGPLSIWDSVPDPVRSVGRYLMAQSTCCENAKVPVPRVDSDEVWEFVLVRISTESE